MTSCSLRHVSSFSSISRAMLLPLACAICSMSLPLRNGCGSCWAALSTWVLGAPAVTTKPPPTDR
ncbi:hypothetical protein D9M70_552560 [compost metagenome]